jgi:hypothetical protein
MLRIILFVVVFLTTASSYGQKHRKNTDLQLFKEDEPNEYQANEVSKIDFLHALDLLGLHIFKFNINKFDTTYRLIITVDEYTMGKITKTDTLYDAPNTYAYFVRGEKESYQDYTNQIKIITKEGLQKNNKNEFTVSIRTYRGKTQESFIYPITEKDQFYTWRKFVDTEWKPDTKIPLLVFASSWLDKKYNFQRFCGVVNLSENEEETTNLLSSSPKYYLFSYKIIRQ